MDEDQVEFVDFPTAPSAGTTLRARFLVLDDDGVPVTEVVSGISEAILPGLDVDADDEDELERLIRAHAPREIVRMYATAGLDDQPTIEDGARVLDLTSYVERGGEVSLSFGG